MSFQDLIHTAFSGGRTRQHQKIDPTKMSLTTSTTKPVKVCSESCSQSTLHTTQRAALRRTKPKRTADNIPVDISSLSCDDAISEETAESSRDDEDSLVASVANVQQEAKSMQRGISSIREKWQRKSDFAKLTHETHQFQKMVTNLERIVKQDITREDPERVWQARILIQSAQETDQAMQEKLSTYERTMEQEHVHRPIHELRMAQMARMKLKRDFDRCRKALNVCLSLYEQMQQAEIRQLGAIRYGNNNVGPIPPHVNGNLVDDTDYFDRAIRQKELEAMNRKMHTVHSIYQELAGLVEVKQQPLEELTSKIADSKHNVEAAAEEISCIGHRNRLWCGTMEVPNSYRTACGTTGMVGVDKTVSLTSDNDDGPPITHGIRINENFHWKMPFETFTEDIRSVRNDILDIGKGIVSQGKQGLQCGGVS